jgi:hypothetical protein
MSSSLLILLSYKNLNSVDLFYYIPTKNNIEQRKNINNISYCLISCRKDTSPITLLEIHELFVNNTLTHNSYSYYNPTT